MGRQEPQGSALLGRMLGRVRLASESALVLDCDEGPVLLRLTPRTRLVAHQDSPLQPGTLVEAAYARVGRIRTAAMVVRLGAPPAQRPRYRRHNEEVPCGLPALPPRVETGSERRLAEVRSAASEGTRLGARTTSVRDRFGHANLESRDPS